MAARRRRRYKVSPAGGQKQKPQQQEFGLQDDYDQAIIYGQMSLKCVRSGQQTNSWIVYRFRFFSCLVHGVQLLCPHNNTNKKSQIKCPMTRGSSSVDKGCRGCYIFDGGVQRKDLKMMINLTEQPGETLFSFGRLPAPSSIIMVNNFMSGTPWISRVSLVWWMKQENLIFEGLTFPSSAAYNSIVIYISKMVTETQSSVVVGVGDLLWCILMTKKLGFQTESYRKFHWRHVFMTDLIYEFENSSCAMMLTTATTRCGLSCTPLLACGFLG